MDYDRYDAVVVLGGGLMKAGAEFHSTDFNHGDQFGMMGGYMRVIAAAALYRGGASNYFVFTTGRAPHQITLHRKDLPTEASVYASEFLRLTGQIAKGARIFMEDRSTSTLNNILEVLTIIRDEGWKCVAIVTNGYHVPRAQALYEQALTANPKIGCAINFLSAEGIVMSDEPGVYDSEIKAAYASEAGRERLRNEEQGVNDIRTGKYAGAKDIHIG